MIGMTADSDTPHVTGKTDEVADRSPGPSHLQGISNRETVETEASERESFPSLQEGSPPPQDAAGRVGEEPLEDRRDRHTSHKAGSRSIAQKEANTRYPDRSMPPARKVPGAFGREPAPDGARAKRK
jgi:hypothetical protein